jgi:general secretion pathway protein A
MSLVLGDVGTGKTTLSRALFQLFSREEDSILFHMILDPDFDSEHAFLSHLAKLFGIRTILKSTMDLRDAIERYLYRKSVDEQKTVVLLIDEAQKLSRPILEVLRTLLNYETNEEKMLQLVIMGQMELLPRIKDMRNFIDRVSFKFIINPLDEEETGDMIRFRLQQAGYGDGRILFSDAAVKRIYDHTQGYPRQIARLCHNAIEHLVMEDREMVTDDLVQRLITRDRLWT